MIIEREEILALCPVCDGAGVIAYSRIISRWADPADAHYEEPCQECDRTGQAWTPAEPITLADLEFRDFLEWTHDAIQVA